MTRCSTPYRLRTTRAQGYPTSTARSGGVSLPTIQPNPGALGFIGSGLKAVDEVWVVESYVHDTQGNGIWCDEECNDTNASPNGTFYVNRNLIVRNGREGIRWEKIGDEATHGEALIEYNSIHANGWESGRPGLGIRDAQDALVRGNIFGAKEIAGVRYGENPNAWRASDRVGQTVPIS